MAPRRRWFESFVITVLGLSFVNELTYNVMTSILHASCMTLYQRAGIEHQQRAMERAHLRQRVAEEHTIEALIAEVEAELASLHSQAVAGGAQV